MAILFVFVFCVNFILNWRQCISHQ
jgi:hypothetical protein